VASPVFDGPVVVISARTAAILGRKFDLQGLRDEVYRSRDRDAHAELMGLHAIAVQYVQGVVSKVSASDCGLAVVPASDVAARSDRQVVVGSSEVARLAGCTQRSVTRAASEKRLKGQFSGGTWWFESEDVAAWLATRPAA
jgi:hypothetical protein